MPDQKGSLDKTDRQIINRLQGGFPVLDRPFNNVAGELRLKECDLIDRIKAMLDEGVLSRFGPMYDVEKMGGAFCLCAMAVPEQRYETVAEQVNAHEEVAHNYEREHAFNMWFVLATGTLDGIEKAAGKIEDETGLPVHLFPKTEEYFIGLKVSV